MAAFAPCGFAPLDPHFAVHAIFHFIQWQLYLLFGGCIPVTMASIPAQPRVPQNHIVRLPTLKKEKNRIQIETSVESLNKPLSVRDVPINAPHAETIVLAKFKVRR
jgi:hypothetical protein